MQETAHNDGKSQKVRLARTGYSMLLRFRSDIAKKLDSWRNRQEDLPNRPEAIRRLVELGLTVRQARVPADGQRARAATLAGEQIDRMTDADATVVDQAKRKGRLLSGPTIFRDVRKDR